MKNRDLVCDCLFCGRTIKTGLVCEYCVENVTVDALQWAGVREEQWVPTGKMERLQNGKERPILRAETHIRTAGLGKLTLESWYELMNIAIRREGLSDLLVDCVKYASTLAWLKTATARIEYGLEMMGHMDTTLKLIEKK